MDPRQELETLRKIKRLRELEAKAGGGVSRQPSDAQPRSSIQVPSGPRGAAQQDIADLQDMPQGLKNGFAKVFAGLGLGGAGSLATSGLTGIAGIAARAGANAGSAGLQKYFSNILDKKQDPSEGVVGNSLVGGGLSLGADAVSSGASKLADWLQQAASGMTKYRPGVGNNLVDQGIWGTKNGMANQVAEALPAKEQEVQNAVAGISGNSDSQPISDAIRRLGEKFKLPSTGEVGANMSGYAQKVNDAADEFASMGEGGELTPADLLATKRQGDWVGYTNSGNKATSLEADIGNAQADKAREMLSNMSDGETARKLADEQALILATKALTKPDSIPNGLGAKAIFMKVPGQSLLGSAAAQGLQKGVAGGANTLSDPRVLQSLFGLSNANSSGQ